MIRGLLLLILAAFAILILAGAVSFAAQTFAEIFSSFRALRQRKLALARAAVDASGAPRAAGHAAAPAVVAATPAVSASAGSAEALPPGRFEAAGAPGPLDEALDAVHIITDRDGVITAFNRGAEALLGYGRDRAVNRMNVLDFFRKGEVQVLTDILNYQLKRRLSPFATLVTECIDGTVEERHWTWAGSCAAEMQVAVTTTAFRNGLGQVAGFHFAARRAEETAPQISPAAAPATASQTEEPAPAPAAEPADRPHAGAGRRKN